MKNLRTLLTLTCIVFTGTLRAQQTPVFSHYYLNPYLLNPAMAGQSKETRAFLLYRQQWVGMPGAPQTQALTIDGPLTETRFGLGLTAINDVTNIMRRSSAMVTGSYAVPLATDHELTFGLSFGVLRNQIDFDKVRGNTSDAGLLLNSDNRTVVDGKAGVTYRYKKFRIGLASEQLFNQSIDFRNAADFRSVTYVLVRHYLVSAQYNFQLNPDFQLTPLLVVRSAQGLPAQFDLNATLKYRDIGWTNIAYRHQSGVAIAVGFNIGERLLAGYNYEIPTSDLRTATTGSHEAMIGFRFINKPSGTSSSSKGASNKALNDFKRDANAQYERLDEIQQRNEALNNELLRYKQTIEEQNNEIERLKKTIGNFDGELKATIDQLKVDLQKETSFDKTFNYYLIIGAHRNLEDARAFQKMIRRETSVKPEILHNDNETWYFLYSDQLKSAKDAKHKIKELESNNVMPLIIGYPWVYKSLKNNVKQ